MSKVQAHRKLSSSPRLCLLIFLSSRDPAWLQSIPGLLGSDVRKQGKGFVRALRVYLGGDHLGLLTLKMRKLRPRKGKDFAKITQLGWSRV